MAGVMGEYSQVERDYSGPYAAGALVIVVLAAMSLLVRTLPGGGSAADVATWFARRQDLPVAGVLAALLIVCGRLATSREARDWPRLRSWQVVAVLGATAVALYLVRVFVLFDYDLSRDEQMVTFDAAIFARGRLFWPIEPFWRSYYDALNANFLLTVGDHEGWVSGYLPGNAGLRTVIGRVLPASAVSPLLVAVSGFALWRIALRLWPDSRTTSSVVLLLFLSSTQVLLMGTTVYSMPTHLAANLVWMWLFLQNRPLADAGAIGVGAFAIGIHQPVFHPVFAIPFLDMLRRERQWRRLVVYLVAYAIVGLMWLAWPNWLSAQGLHSVPATANLDGTSYLERLTRNFVTPSDASLWIMGANLLRFVTWQHVLLVPLAIYGLRVGGRGDPVARACWQGIALLIAMITILMPMQFHGWGYRYLHGFIGSAVLLAGFGWHALEREGRLPLRALALTSAVSLVVILPAHLGMVRSFMAPFAQAAERLRRLPADVVIVDDVEASFGGDLVLNRADLSNRPLFMSSFALDPDLLPALCQGRRVILVEGPAFTQFNRMFGAPELTGPSDQARALEDRARAARCGMAVLRDISGVTNGAQT